MVNQKNKIFIGILFGFTLAVFFPALFAGFIWDDDVIVNNPMIQMPTGLWHLWFSPKSYFIESHYWPVTYTTFWLEYRLWGTSAFGYHLVNILLHALNVILLWFILRKLDIPGQVFIAFIYALHPVHVESVAWVIERKDVLSTLFYFLSLLLYLKYFTNASRFKTATYLWSLFLFSCAMLSKSVAITLPVTLFLLLWWKKDGFEKKEIMDIIPFFLIAFIIGYFDLRFAQQGTSFNSGLSWLQRLFLAGQAFWFYLGKLILPLDLMTIYPKWKLDSLSLLHYLYPVSILVGLMFLFLLRKKIGKGPVVAFLFYLITLAPTLGLIDFSFMQHSYVADRFQYLASIGPIILFGAIAMKFYQNKPAWQTALRFLAIILLAMLGILTWKQTTLYKNNETLFSYTIQKNPNAWQAYYLLGLELARKNQSESAIDYYQRSIELNPSIAEPYNTLANLFLKEGNPELAAEYYQKAIDRDPKISEVYVNLGVALAMQGKLNEAIPQFEKALTLNPDNAQAKYNLEKAINELQNRESKDRKNQNR